MLSPGWEWEPLPWADAVAVETALGETEGRWHVLTALCGGTVAQLGCCFRMVTAAAPSCPLSSPCLQAESQSEPDLS